MRGDLICQVAVTKAFQAFTEKWKPEADAVTDISALTDVGKFTNPLEVAKTLVLTKIKCGGVQLAKDATVTYQEALAAHKSGVRMLWLFGLPTLVSAGAVMIYLAREVSLAAFGLRLIQ